MYTVRAFTKDLDSFSETLKRIADIGYTSVQVSGTCEFEAAWLRDELKKNGLVCPITHTKPQAMLDDAAAVCRDHLTFGATRVGLGMMPDGKNLDDALYERFVAEFLPVAKAIKENGCKFAYHHHHYEFIRSANGQRFIDRMLEDFPADLLTEADSYQTTLQTFKNTFNEKRFFIHLTIGHSENESIENALRDLEARYKNGDPSGYASARSRLISAIERIIDTESLSLYTVF
jgi:sugar phosphate isomerase/epimerase